MVLNGCVWYLEPFCDFSWRCQWIFFQLSLYDIVIKICPLPGTCSIFQTQISLAKMDKPLLNFRTSKIARKFWVARVALLPFLVAHFSINFYTCFKWSKSRVCLIIFKRCLYSFNRHHQLKIGPQLTYTKNTLYFLANLIDLSCSVVMENCSRSN